MGDVMQGIEQDVPFDHGHADTLISACNAAASVIDSQTGSRSAWLTYGLEDFEGYYAQLFQQNGSVQASDATLVAIRLREIATAVGDLKRAAAAEQKRRETARAWKQRQDHRNLFQMVGDWLSGGEQPPVGPPDPEPQLSVTAVTPQPRQPLTGSSSTGVSSGRPANLRSFATNSLGGNEELRPKAAAVRSAYNDFTGSCGWGRLEASGVISGFDSYISANDEDVRWANVVAEAFEAAGSSGTVTAPNASITAAIEAAGVNAERTELKIDPPQAYGAPPTTGYANDPVNTATGNFLEPETDMAFDGGCSALLMGRMYNSLNREVGAFGPGWSSWTEAGLRFDDSQARWTQFDGREILFPRLGEGWDRATTEAFWLTAEDEGHRITDNKGGWWRFDAAGRLVEYAAGEGFAIALRWVEGRLQCLTHERGRSVSLVWDDDRVQAAESSDGRRVEYVYDDDRRLVAAVSDRGTRRYDWDEAGLMFRITDGDGVVEVENTYDDRGRVTTQRSQHGRITHFTYLPGHMTGVADADGNRSNVWVHDAWGRLVRIVDSDGQSTSLARDRYGNVVMSTERDGGITVSEYDHRSRLITRVTPSGARVENEWDEQDRLCAVQVYASDEPATTTFTYEGSSRLPSCVVDGTGGVTKLEWERGQLTQVEDPTGVRFLVGYDEHGDVVVMADGAGNASRLERDVMGRIVASITPMGNVTRYVWDADRLTARIDPDGARWGFEYTAAGRLEATVDPLGARTVIAHDECGEASLVTDPLGRGTASFYDDLGNLAAMELPDGRRWEYTHNALSRLVSMMDPEGGCWRWEYDVNGRPTRQEDPTGRAWVTEYSVDRSTVMEGPGRDGASRSSLVFDRVGRIVSATGVRGGTVLTRYDGCGRPVEYVDAEGGVTSMTRDAAGRIVRLRRPDDSMSEYAYDEVTGRLVSVTNALGETTRFVNDADNRLVAEIDPLGGETRYEYDVCGRVIAVSSPGYGRSTWTYDLAGRVIATWSRFLGRRRFSYDAAGQLVEARDALGRVTRYGYDVGGRAVEVTDPLGNVTVREFNGLDLHVVETDPLGRTKRFGYDAAGRLISHDRATGQRLEWVYDADGLLHQVIADGQIAATHHHDVAAGTLVVEDATDPDQPVTHRLRWDLSGRLIEQIRSDHATGTDRITSWGYDSLGRCVVVTAPSGDVARFGYDLLGRCVEVVGVGGRVVQGFDAAGCLVSSWGPGGRQWWEYAGGEVVRHVVEVDGECRETVVERDGQGRIAGIVEGGWRVEYVHDAAGQLVEVRSPEGRCRWVYDAGGRLVAEERDDALIRYVYDAAGQLLEQHCDGGGVTRFSYDAAGRRISQDGPHGRTEYRWSALGWLTSITQPSGVTSVHVNALSELARVNDVEVFWGSPSSVLEVGGVSVTPIPGMVAVGEQWGVTGWREQRYSDPAAPWTPSSGVGLDGIGVGAGGCLFFAGMEWLGYRVHDPNTRGFLSRDPLVPVVGAAWVGNPYAYAGNDPLHAVDPQGLRPVTDAELQQYIQQNHSSRLNWKTFVGVAVTIVGIAVTPVCPIAGGAIAGAGISLASQGVFSPGQPVDWGSVAIGGAFGALGGGVASYIAHAAKGGSAAAQAVQGFWPQVGINAAVGAGGGATDGLYTGLNSGLQGWDLVKHVSFNTLLGAGTSALATGISETIKNPVQKAWEGIQDRLKGSSSAGSSPASGTSDVVPSSSVPEIPVAPQQPVPHTELTSPDVAPRRAAPEPYPTQPPADVLPRRAAPRRAAPELYPLEPITDVPPRRALPGFEGGDW